MSERPPDQRRINILSTPLTIIAVRNILHRAGTSLLDEAALHATGSSHIAECYLGTMFDLVDQQESTDLPGTHLGLAMYVSRTQIRIRYGDPELAGTLSPLAPRTDDEYTTADLAARTILLVDQHIATAFDDVQNT